MYSRISLKKGTDGAGSKIGVGEGVGNRAERWEVGVWLMARHGAVCRRCPESCCDGHAVCCNQYLWESATKVLPLEGGVYVL